MNGSTRFPEFERHEGGRVLMTGCLPRQTPCGGIEGVKIWSPEFESCPIVPRDQWSTQPSLRPYEWRDNDQDGYPSCTLTSLANYAEFFLARTGRKKTPLDWLKAWRKLSGGYGGVALDAALRYVMSEGYPLLDGSGVLVATEVWDLSSTDAAFSAMTLGQGFWYGASGHAEWGASLLKSGAGVSAEIRGTWGRDYGQGGWYPRSESYIRAGIPSYGAFCIREWELRPIDLA